VAVICASGQRSAVAASLLTLHGAGHVIHVAGGGVGTWQRSGWPVTQAKTSVTA
jgi:rhodanese-related sulfurtransferase